MKNRSLALTGIALKAINNAHGLDAFPNDESNAYPLEAGRSGLYFSVAFWAGSESPDSANSKEEMLKVKDCLAKELLAATFH